MSLRAASSSLAVVALLSAPVLAQSRILPPGSVVIVVDDPATAANEASVVLTSTPMLLTPRRYAERALAAAESADVLADALRQCAEREAERGPPTEPESRWSLYLAIAAVSVAGGLYLGSR